MITKKLSIILGFVAVLAVIVGYAAFRDRSQNDMTSGQNVAPGGGLAPSNVVDPKSANTIPSDTIVTEIPKSEIDTRKTYTNKEYGFSFQYPAAWGEVELIVEKNNPEFDKDAYCRARGYALFGRFSNSKMANLQFGAVSSDYKICLGRGGGLVDYVKFDIIGNVMRLYTWANSAVGYTDYKIEKEVSTATAGTSAYVFKNTSWTDEEHALPAAILESPSSKIGALSFQTFEAPYSDAMGSLQHVLSTFSYIR